MILSQARDNGHWTEIRVQRRTRYEKKSGSELLGRLEGIHDPDHCQHRGCAIHNHPSDHPLADAPLNWRIDRGILERICRHGIGHPDADQTAYWRTILSEDAVRVHTSHGCDGCCRRLAGTTTKEEK